jgi:hypothetical protein
MRNTADVTGGKPIAVLLQSISGVCPINPLVAFHDIHGGKSEVLFFNFVPDTTRDKNSDQVFGVLTEFLRSPIKQYFCMNAIIFECYFLTYLFYYTRILVFWSRYKVTAQRAIAEAKQRA